MLHVCLVFYSKCIYLLDNSDNCKIMSVKIEENLFQRKKHTRVHLSRMHTARLVAILVGVGVGLGGVVSAQGDVCPGGVST